MTTRTTLTTTIRRAIHTSEVTMPRPLLTAPVIRRKGRGPYGITSKPVGFFSNASAQVGCDDEGRRVVHCRIEHDHTEHPVCRARGASRRATASPPWPISAR
jgi:hypothetical protein